MPTSVPAAEVAPTRPGGVSPYSRQLRIAAGASLVLAGLLNGLTQYVGFLVIGDLDFSEQIRWGAEHPDFHRVEQVLLVVSTLFMPLGLLGVAHVCRFTNPLLTAIATPLVVWGMWGFHNVLAMGYVSGTVAPAVLTVDQAVTLNEGLVTEAGTVATALAPHLIGSLLGLGLLSIAAWRAGAFPRPAIGLLLIFLVWDFFLEPVGPLEPHLFLALSWVWMGWHLLKLPDETWQGAHTRTDPTFGDDRAASSAY